jgi:hypothetical protein
MHYKTLAILALALAGAAQAQTTAGPVIYPAKGQSAQQQDKDKYECHDWARKQSGFDPTQPAPAAQGTQTAPSTSSSGKSSGSAAGGMAAGAMGGAAVAELSHHDAGRGAAIGALGAAAVGRMKEAQARQQQQAQQQQQQQQQVQQQAAARQSQRSVYERAFGACLEARGYTVR